MNRPVDALSPLIAAGKEHPNALEAVWKALAAYDDEQLAPYAEDIQLLLDDTYKLPNAPEAVSAAYDRLVMIAKGT
jgi:hypothetical protein